MPLNFFEELILVRPVSMQVEDVTVSVMEGDARSIICDAVNIHHASILVVGSHGYGALKRWSYYT